ncbi:MAG: hypothetical protein IPG78_19445 [Ignavibacteria bacterium]|nr:hypothetical protein [Ignavibacteria bacterium]
MCEEFFINQDFRNDQQRDIRLLRQYCKRGFKPKADKIISRLEKFIERPAVNGLDYFKRMEMLDAMDIYYTSHDNRSMRNQHLIKSLLNLDYYFIIQSLIFKKNYTQENSILKINPMIHYR